MPRLSNPPVFLSEPDRYLDGHSRTRYGYEFDTQRQKLYDAERAAFSNDFNGKNPVFDDVQSMQVYIDHLTTSAWFRRRWPNCHHITVKDGRGRRKACGGRRRRSYGSYYGIIKMPRWSRTQPILLHETAHVLVPKPHAWHGRLYARTYLEFVRHKMGEASYNRLLDAFREHNVKWHPHNRNVVQPTA